MLLTSSQIGQQLRSVRGRSVGIIGAGRSGLAAGRLALNMGAQLHIFDEKGADKNAIQQLKAQAQKLNLSCALHVGVFSEATMSATDLLVVSPGVPLQHAVLQQLQARGQLLVSEVDLALAQFDVPVIAITGTNGKSTVTTMIGDLLRALGKKPFVGGNLGVPLSDAVVDGQSYDVLVLELSSYQLELCRLLRPRVAIVTNLAPDHLSRYPDLDAYYDVKRSIYRQLDPQGCVLLRAQDVAAGLFADAPAAALWTYAEPDDDADPPATCRLRIKGKSLLVRKNGDAAPDMWHEIVVDNPHVMGAHNMQNMAAALLATLAMGLPVDALQGAIKAYRGIAHRLQRVAERQGVLYVNDSKATNVDATLKALQAFDRPIHLIAGGLAKGDDLSLIARAAKGRVRSLVAIGQAAADIDAALAGVVAVRERADSMRQAVRQASAHARAGDVVLLSPACASFDQFKNFEQRGQAFVQAVLALDGEGA